MRNSRLAVIVFLSMACVLPSWGQRGEGYGDFMTPQVRSDRLSAPERLRSYVVEGRLRLGLRDAVVATLQNNSLVRIQQTQVETSKFNLLGAHAPFDPLITSTDSIMSTISPPFSFLQGLGSVNVNFKSATKNLQFDYSQTFQTGTKVQAGIGGSVNSSSPNDSFFFFNPYTTATLSFQFVQPLLRNGWLFANRAPLIIARRNLQLSRSTF